MQLTIEQAFQRGMQALDRGEINQAESILSAIAEVDASNAKVHYNLGLIRLKSGCPEAAISGLVSAINTDPSLTEYWIGYINALAALNKTKELKKAFKDAKKNGVPAATLKHLKKRNQSATASISKLMQKEVPNQLLHEIHSLYQQSKFELAIQKIDSLVKEYPYSAKLYYLSGLINDESMDKKGQSIESYKKALELNPEFVEAHFNLGSVLRRTGDIQGSVKSYKKAVRLAPQMHQAFNNLGAAYHDLGNHKFAIENHKRAIELNPEYSEGYLGLGVSLIADGKKQEALQIFKECFALMRGNTAHPDHRSFKLISKAKIDFDISQFEYLADVTDQTERFKTLASLYKKISSEINWQSETDVLLLSDRHKELLKHSFNRPIHMLEAPEIKGTTLNEALDRELITSNYFSHESGLAHFDDFLNQEAIEQLRTFLLGSTIWYDYFHPGGYVGAYLKEGLACPLILQIAEDLRESFPDIFKNHPLNQVWAFTHDSRAHKSDNTLAGIGVHGDDAAINVNFWITPKAANLNAKSGGLVVYDAEAPSQWDFKKINNPTNIERLCQHIQDQGDNKTVVPYNENRVCIFNSNLLHQMDSFEFMDGYDCRRIAVTMLFGRRKR
ncbi:tetratricopeptide repeat protein [Porticoccaceae bacterium]|nr:tetratricopeptide repeat protein [Porticoccaceae bacterium]